MWILQADSLVEVSAEVRTSRRAKRGGEARLMYELHESGKPVLGICKLPRRWKMGGTGNTDPVKV